MGDKGNTIESYYRARAPIYDKVYEYPERQNDLRFLEEYIPQRFAGKTVLEIAAGTGYWTQFIAAHATRVLAIDATESVLAQIAHRPNTLNVTTKIHDAYAIQSLKLNFTALFAGLWLSHVPKQQLRLFLENSLSKVEPGSPVLFIDNSIAQCSRLPISYQDQHGNSYQTRTLEDGKAYDILKNFPTQMELESSIKGLATVVNYIEMENFWLLDARVN